LVALSEDLGQPIPFAIWIIDALTIPIVGLFNALVYSKHMDPMQAAVRRSVRSVQLNLRSNSSGTLDTTNTSADGQQNKNSLSMPSGISENIGENEKEQDSDVLSQAFDTNEMKV